MSQRQRRRKKHRRKQAAERRGPTKRQVAASATIVMGATLAATGSAQAADFTVNNLGDNGQGTLRQAILDANANAGPDRILFQSGLSGTITLTTGELYVDEAVQILGPGAGQLAISGDETTRLFNMEAATDGEPVSISGLTLTRGHTEGPGARNGGAIFNDNMNLTIADSVLSGNTSLGDGTHDGYGGAICACSGYGSLTVVNSTFSGNISGGSGGGIYSDLAPLTIKGSTFVGNRTYYRGGAISDCCANSDSTIENSTFTDNSVGGVDPGYGGALFTYADTNLTITGSTVSGNSAARGGGVAENASAPPTLRSTIAANDHAAIAGPDVFGDANSAFSLIRDTSGATVNQTGPNLFGLDPQLGPLQNNGGPTPTEALATTSPAIDKGAAFGLGSDQRGVQRPIDFPGIANAPGGDGSDIGAFELQPSNALKLKKLKRNKHKGTGKQVVKLPLPDAGSVTIKGKGLKTKTKQVTGAAKLKLPVIPKGKKKAQENATGSVKLKAKITYKPTGNAAKTIKRKLKLLKT